MSDPKPPLMSPELRADLDKVRWARLAGAAVVWRVAFRHKPRTRTAGLGFLAGLALGIMIGD